MLTKVVGEEGSVLQATSPERWELLGVVVWQRASTAVIGGSGTLDLHGAGLFQFEVRRGSTKVLCL